MVVHLRRHPLPCQQTLRSCTPTSYTVRTSLNISSHPLSFGPCFSFLHEDVNADLCHDWLSSFVVYAAPSTSHRTGTAEVASPPPLAAPNSSLAAEIESEQDVDNNGPFLLSLAGEEPERSRLRANSTWKPHKAVAKVSHAAYILFLFPSFWEHFFY